MPRATVSTDNTRIDLKTCPEGFVEIKALPYGQWLQRQDIAMQMQVEGMGDKNAKATMQAANKAVTTFEFSRCIVRHNLTAAPPKDAPEGTEGPLLDFAANGIDVLDPRIGEEISAAIMKMHEFDEGN